jgi:hypothetical protein
MCLIRLWLTVSKPGLPEKTRSTGRVLLFDFGVSGLLRVELPGFGVVSIHRRLFLFIGWIIVHLLLVVNP